jgi:hypothetical protein
MKHLLEVDTSNLSRRAQVRHVGGRDMVVNVLMAR